MQQYVLIALVFIKVFIWIGDFSASYTHETIKTQCKTLLYKVPKLQKDIQVYFNGDFTSKILLQELGFKPTTIRLMSSSQGTTFLTEIFISPMGHFAPVGNQNSEGPSKGHEDPKFSNP